MKQIKWLALASMMLAAIPAGAQAPAEHKGWYGMIGAGRTDANMNDDYLTSQGATSSSLLKDERDSGWRFQAGYRINPNFAIEGGHIDFGKFSGTREVTAPAAGTGAATTKSSGWNIDLVGIVPFSRDFYGLARIGGMYSTTKSSITATGAFTPSSGADLAPKKNELNLRLGVGVGYDFNKTFGIRGEYERTSDVGNQNTGELDVGMWSAAVVWRF